MFSIAELPEGMKLFGLILQIAIGFALFFQFREIIAIGWKHLVRAWNHPNRWRAGSGRGPRRW